MHPFEILPVDSDIFGYPVAKILPVRLGPDGLKEVISALRGQAVRLAYWASQPDDDASQKAARLYNGFLADRKVTYLSRLGDVAEQPQENEWSIDEYSDKESCPDLDALAIQVGRRSRFHADPRISDEQLCAMYTLWIQNSVNRQLADAVLVARRSGRIVGMVTLGAKKGRGDIGLFAVDPEMRRRNLGSALVQAAQTWTRQKGLPLAQVVTQEKNVAACRLYEKCGYRVEKVDFFYHFWL